MISLAKIKQEILYKQLAASEDKPENKALVQERLPKAYNAFKDIFSKANSNTLPPH